MSNSCELVSDLKSQLDVASLELDTNGKTRRALIISRLEIYQKIRNLKEIELNNELIYLQSQLETITLDYETALKKRLVLIMNISKLICKIKTLNHLPV
jgi:hypothetical protein